MAYKKVDKNYKNKSQTNAERIQKENPYLGIFGSVALMVICLFILLIWLDSAHNYMNIYNNGNQTVATIHRIRRSSGRGRNYHIYVRYRTNNSNIERLERLESIGSRRLASHPIGTNVVIRYHPDNPTTILHATPRDIILDTIFFTVFFGSLIILGIAGLRRRYLYGKG